jgi:O-antigen/teichoic acid export membrane protein
MKAHIQNAAWGILDYLAYPLGMIFVAPIALRALGVDRYGVWSAATAAISLGAIASSGFGDANIRAVARQDAAGDRLTLVKVVRTTLGIHLVLGTVVAMLGWIIAPWLARRIVVTDPQLHADCLWSLRLASLLMLIRAVETVCVSTQRAFQRYQAALCLSLAARLASLVAACVLPFLARSVSVVLIATLLLSLVATWFQFSQLKLLLGVTRLYPGFEPGVTGSLLSFGLFTWLQSLAGLLFGQLDRLIAGAAFGAAAIAAYTFCAQLSQPVYGISAAGQHFLFPYLASREAANDLTALRRGTIAMVAINGLFVTLSLVGILLFGKPILRMWAGEAIAAQSGRLLPLLAWSAAVSALGITGSYSMLALGRARTVTASTLLGCAVMLGSMPWLLRFGLPGMGIARLLYCPFALLIYFPLFTTLNHNSRRVAPSAGAPVYEEA